jgi:DNA-binding CsgD family transcriptional regulator
MTVVPDPITVIEAGYELDLDEREWLRRIAVALRPLLEGGHGITAYTFDVAAPPEVWLQNPVLVGADPEAARHAISMLSHVGSTATGLHTDPEPLIGGIEGFVRQGYPRTALPEAWHDHCRRLGVKDYLGLRTIEPGGRGIGVTGGQDREPRLDRRTQRLWARVSAHLAAARRLRETLSKAAEATVADEAILRPSGHLAHAEGVAKDRSLREALRQAVLRQERARGRMRRQDPEGATEAWTALVTGRWSLVDRFESDGRRYVVAHANDVRVPDPRALSERERSVAHLAALGKTNKLIAYELGLSSSTIATHLSAALRKLGLESRTQLVAVLAGLGGGQAR